MLALAHPLSPFVRPKSYSISDGLRGSRQADNRITRLGVDDPDALANLLQSILEEAATLVGTGFYNADLDKLLDELGRDPLGGLTEPDAVPDPPEDPASRTGDLYVLDQHKALCGDATNSNDVTRVLDGEQADLAVTDPPYGVSYVGKTAKKLTIQNDDLGPEFYDFLYAACKNIMAVTKGAIYIFMSSSEQHTLIKAFREAGGHWSDFIIWVKNNFTLGRSDYQRQYEPILYGWPEKVPHFWCGDRNQGNTWSIDKPSVNDLHPTMKPVELLQKAIRNSSRIGGVVFDPFGGSGSTLIACETTGRRSRLLEIDPRYVDVIIKRWQDYTGRQAVLEGDGRTFNEIAIERAQAK